jgi:hypothetical protein
MEANKIGISVVNTTFDYFNNNGNCIIQGNNNRFKNRRINYKRYGIELWKRIR